MMWLELNLAVQLWVSSVKSSGLSTQPCGAPVLSVVGLEVLWPTRTDWGLPVKKSRIQLQRELLRPSRLNLLMSCCGIIVLNAELKSMNSILTYESLFSRWVRARWRVEEIASSVERFGRYANWSDRVCWGCWFWCCAWLASQSTSLWLESVLWDGSHLDRTQVIFLVPVWLSWIWDMWGWLPGSARCWRYLLGHLSAVQHSLSVRGQVYCQDPQPCVG